MIAHMPDSQMTSEIINQFLYLQILWMVYKKDAKCTRIFYSSKSSNFQKNLTPVKVTYTVCIRCFCKPCNTQTHTHKHGWHPPLERELTSFLVVINCLNGILPVLSTAMSSTIWSRFNFPARSCSKPNMTIPLNLSGPTPLLKLKNFGAECLAVTVIKNERSHTHLTDGKCSSVNALMDVFSIWSDPAFTCLWRNIVLLIWIT